MWLKKGDREIWCMALLIVSFSLRIRTLAGWKGFYPSWHAFYVEATYVDDQPPAWGYTPLAPVICDFLVSNGSDWYDLNEWIRHWCWEIKPPLGPFFSASWQNDPHAEGQQILLYFSLLSPWTIISSPLEFSIFLCTRNYQQRLKMTSYRRCQL